jgi:hypothetical protein
VTSYTVTITPDDSSGTTTTLRLDVAGGQVRLTDLHLHAGTGLSTGQLPAIDFGLLLQAVNPGTARTIEAAADSVEEVPAAAAMAPRRRAVRKAAKAARGGRRPGRSAEKATAGRGRAKKAAAATGSGDRDRAYRRMPDDLAEVYQRIGSPTAVAQHYQVPRHTVHGWLRRLRQQGLLPSS